LSFIQQGYDWDWRGAEASTRRALELAPGNPEVLRAAGRLGHSVGHLDQALPLYLRAIEQDPLSPGGYREHGMLYRSMGRFADAERSLRKALELPPLRVASHMVLAIVLAEQGRGDEALAELNLEPAEWARLTGLAYVHHAGGRTREAREALQQLEAR